MAIQVNNGEIRVIPAPAKREDPSQGKKILKVALTGIAMVATGVASISAFAVAELGVTGVIVIGAPVTIPLAILGLIMGVSAVALMYLFSKSIRDLSKGKKAVPPQSPPRIQPPQQRRIISNLSPQELRIGSPMPQTQNLSPKPQVNESSVPQGQPKPPLQSSQNSNKLDRDMQEFQINALNALARRPQNEPPVDFSLSASQLRDLDIANRIVDEIREKDLMQPCSMRKENGFTIIKGGINYVIILDSVPGFVFKPMRIENHVDDPMKHLVADRYIKNTNDAIKNINDHKLYLLHVPQAEKLKHNGRFYVMQQKEDILTKNFWGQKAIYKHCWNDPKMRPYMIKVFAQLAVFICATNFADVKYDNIPFTKNGKMALVDLDQISKEMGLFEGRAEKQVNGLFNYIPKEHFEEFVIYLKQIVPPKEFETFNKQIIKCRNRAAVKAVKKQKRTAFFQRNRIKHTAQPIAQPRYPNTFTPREQQFTNALINMINDDIQKGDNFSVNYARRIVIKLGERDPLWLKINELTGGNLSPEEFNRLLDKALSFLKTEGYIYNYNDNYTYLQSEKACKIHY